MYIGITSWDNILEVMMMLDRQEAYHMLGLATGASLREVEHRYHCMVRRLRANELRGCSTMLEELQMRGATMAYRFLLDQERERIIANYRMSRYGRFRSFSHLAERIDETFERHKLAFLLSIVLTVILGLSYAGIHGMIKEQAALAAAPQPDLSIMIAAQLPLDHLQTASHRLIQHLVEHYPELNNPKLIFLPAAGSERDFALSTETPDLYLLDRDSFIHLMKLGYLGKLEEWDSYGMNVSQAAVSSLIGFQEEPFIAAVHIQSQRSEQAASIIRGLLSNTAEIEPYADFEQRAGIE